MITEADTCRKYVLPRLIQSGWDSEPHSFTEQKTFTDGRIVIVSEQHRIVEHLDALQAEADGLKRLQAESAAELDALLPSILDKAFKGEL